mgnify:CR=1 FL=1
MLGWVLKACVLCRTLSVAEKFRHGYRRDREVKFYFAEFLDKALKSHFYKILKSRFYALKFYARRSFKFRFGGCGPCAAAPNTHHLKFYDRAAEFLRGGALKFYRRAVKKIRIAEKFIKIAKFHRTKFRYAVKFYYPKFCLLAKFYHSAEFKCLQYRKASVVSYARSGFCR